MRIAERKLLELRRKLAGITAEFDWWLADAGEKRPLRKHQSQITRLTDQLSGLAGRVQDEIGQALQDGGDILGASRDLQLRILEVHRLWDFFRSKLSLRYVAWFGPYLAVADEFAWACYRQALDHDSRADVPAAGIKAAPLVFLSGEFSPFTHPRQSPFDVEGVEGALDSVDFLQVLYALPVPVIGLPWYQVAHLPDVVAIAHEVGHDVERDLELTAVMQGHLRAATATTPGPLRNRWFGWLPEIFADLYGILSAGPAFASALTDLLAADPALVAAESADSRPAKHPPAALRIELAAQALEQTGFPREAAGQRDAWAEAYGPGDTEGDPVEPFLADAEVVVRELLDGRYPQFRCQRLRDVAAFSAGQQDDANAAAEAVLGGLEPPGDDIRCLVAAARLAFDRDPARYHLAEEGAKTAQELIVERAVDNMSDSVRAGEEDTPAPAPDEDRAAGAGLFDLITALTARHAGARRNAGTA
jgi:hypothetical protein